MNGRRALGGLCTLCALLLSAFAAQSATAAGITGFTCTESAASKAFTTEHCVPGQTGSKVGHVAITEKTEGKVSNLKTNETTTESTSAVLKETIAATNLELRATSVSSEGIGENKEVGGVMEGTATGATTYTGVTVAAPAEKGCKVFEDVEGTKTEGAEGVIKTRPLKGRTFINGAVHEGILEPETGTVFATFFLTCTKGLGVPEALEGTWEMTGSVRCPIRGATVLCNHTDVTTQNTLKGKGSKAGVQVITTGTARKNNTQAFTPLSSTTTP